MKTYIPEVVAEDDPMRCHGLNTNGQCRFKKLSDSNYCGHHGGHVAVNNEAKRALNMYRLEKWETRVAEMAMSSEAKSLKEEVGILRMILEERLNLIKNNTELVINVPIISDLVTKIANVVKMMHNIDISLGNTLDKTVLHQFAAEIVAIISNHVTDETVLSKITKDFEDTLDRIGDLVQGNQVL